MGSRVRVSAFVLALPVLAACATYWPTLDGNSRASAADTYKCTKEQAAHNGFKPITWNDGSMSFDARRGDTAATRDLPGEQRQLDRLSVQVKRPSAGSGSSMSVRAETVVMRFSREGWVSENRPASAGAKEAARELIRQCGGT
jgi:hypothetical protein